MFLNPNFERVQTIPGAAQTDILALDASIDGKVRDVFQKKWWWLGRK